MPHALTIRHKKAKPGQPAPYYPLHLKLIPKPTPGPGHVLVRIHAAALNHRDHFIRQNLYPSISFEAPLFSDGYGVVEALGPDCTNPGLLNQPVILTPCRGWASSPDGPEDWAEFATIGGVEPHVTRGAAQNYCVVEEGEVEVCPPHLSAVEGAALPSCGLTAWRAFFVKLGENAQAGRNVLVTGIGGGVALQVLQFAVAVGCDVFVTSSSEAKIAKARALGAKGGVDYKSDEWPKRLAGLLPAERPYLDAVVDGAGGDIVIRSLGLLKPGGVISCYGMTVAPVVMDWPMQAVLKNIELRGSTLGSRDEFAEMVRFVGERGIRPVVSRTVKGLDVTTCQAMSAL
ncbi:oxidoreductase [Bombardia bombarda]|uniref:Oxidoreductase n=1 Tax=Bombardia bombarda TaxID=252184 RepID=A0AA39XAJ0_9PEZI|nr:oxidoreductase [Bombardia bombarda]